MRCGLEIRLGSTATALRPTPPPPRVGALARFSASEPWLFKRAPAVLITLSLGTLTHTDAGAYTRECATALVKGKKHLHARVDEA